MKKILLFCAAMVAAFNANAAITEMTCAQAIISWLSIPFTSGLITH